MRNLRKVPVLKLKLPTGKTDSKCMWEKEREDKIKSNNLLEKKRKQEIGEWLSPERIDSFYL